MTTGRNLLVSGGLLLAAFAVVAACSSGDDGATEDSAAPAAATASTHDGGSLEVIPALFDDAALAEAVGLVDCTLVDGTDTSCFRVVVHSIPDTVDPGPFCPTTVESDDSGIFTWDGDDPGLYALDAAFWALTDSLGYSFSQPDGTIDISDPGDAGGAPSGDSCLEATPDDSYTLAALVPAEPSLLDEPTQLDTVAQVGIALDGVTVFGDAPSGTSGAIPALDPCGGHVDPSGYYHWHFGSSAIQRNLDAADVARTCGEPQDDDGTFGFAYDGHAIVGPHEADGSHPEGLDECSGHVGDTEALGVVYHYHLTEQNPNLPTCLVGAVAEDKLSSPDNPAASLPDGGGPGGGGPGGGPGGPGAGQGGPPGG